MPSLDDAINAIHDIISNRFGAPAGSAANVSVAFEFGTAINAAELQLPSTPPTFLPARAVELMSGMANVVPRLHDGFFERGLRTVDGQYEVLLRGSQPSSATGVDGFSAIKADALRSFEEVLQSIEGLHQFHAVTANPSNWFDPAVTENWSHFHVKSQTDAAPEDLHESRRLDPRLARFRVLSTEPPPVPPSIAAHLLQLSAATELSQPAPHLTTTQTFQADVIDVSQHQPVIVEFWATWCGPCRAATPKLQSALQSAKTAIHWVRIDVDKDAVQSFVATNAIPTLVAFMNGRAANRLVGPGTDAKLSAFMQSIDDTFIPTGSNRVEIDFDMCIVQLSRSWFSDGFLSLRGWFVPGFGKGEFSDGATFDDPGNLGAVPIACVLIRNLVIKAQWTTADMSALASATNLGPFSLHDHQFDQHAGTLTVPGMQSIAWVCAKMPLLPPDDAPPAPA